MGLKVPSNQSGTPGSVRDEPLGPLCDQTLLQPEHLLCPHRMNLGQPAGSMQRSGNQSQLQGAPRQSKQQQVHIPALPSSALRQPLEPQWHSKVTLMP